MTRRKRKARTFVQQPGAQLYHRFVAGIKKHIRTAQIKAALAAKAELILHYWEIGRDIIDPPSEPLLPEKPKIGFIP